MNINNNNSNSNSNSSYSNNNNVNYNVPRFYREESKDILDKFIKLHSNIEIQVDFILFYFIQFLYFYIFIFLYFLL